MNIFVLSFDPKSCARQHCDKHVVKMVTEYAQLLSTAVHVTGGVAPYKMTHVNHPCSLWTRRSIQNWNWLMELGLELGAEYRFRYGREHKSTGVLKWLRENAELQLPDFRLTRPALAMPEEYRVQSVVQSYRNFYLGDKVRFARWTRRDPPDWWVPLGGSNE